jgi:hypothetical protein
VRTRLRKKGGGMYQKSTQVFKCLSRGCLCVLLAYAAMTICMAQDKKVTQTAGVDDTRMGAYRALAQLSFQAFQRGDFVAASELARILERTWDGAEGAGGTRSLIATNQDVFRKVDRAMDVFINPIMNHPKKAPDPAAVQAAYDDFLEKLKQAD